MEVDGVTVAIVVGAFGLLTGAIGHWTALRTAGTSSETELSVTEKAAQKEVDLKEMEINHAIEMAEKEFTSQQTFDQQKFVREIIQKTLETGSAEEQIRNLRAYARIGLIDAPYADRILALESEELPSTTTYERILSDESFDLPISYFRKLGKTSEAIGRLSYPGDDDRAPTVATGFVMGSGLLLTANHALKTLEGAKSSQLILESFNTDENGNPKSEEFHLDPERLFITDQNLYYTLVAIKVTSTNGRNIAEFGKVLAPSTQGKIQIGERVNTIHFPLGGPKRVSMREGSIIAMRDQMLHYHTATSPGSAGAPIFSDAFELLALHHAKISKPGGEAGFFAGEGIRWSAISNHLRGIYGSLPVAQQDLLSSIWEKTSPQKLPD